MNLYGYPTGYTPTLYYNPNPHHPRQSPPDPDPLTDTVKQTALKAGATHLSKDGLTAYDERGGYLWSCTWDNETKRFGSWFRGEWGQKMPDGVVTVK